MTIWGSNGFGRRGRAIGAASALLTAGAVVAACGSASQQTAAPKAATSGSSIAGQTITLYNGQHEQTTDALVKAFEKQTGVTVKVRSDDEDVLAQQIAQEGNHSPADVFYTENTPPLVRLDEKGLLAPVSADSSVRQVLLNVATHDENPLLRNVSRTMLQQMPQVQ